MTRKPFEIVAECLMAGLPTGADIGRIREQIETARRSRHEVVRAAVNPPAIHRDIQYVLQTRFVVWAEDNARAVEVVEGLMLDAGVSYLSVLPSGRAMAEADVPPPPKTGKTKRTAPRRTPAPKRLPRTKKSRRSP